MEMNDTNIKGYCPVEPVGSGPEILGSDGLYCPDWRHGIAIWLKSQILEFRYSAWALLLCVIDDQANDLHATPLID